MKPNNIWIWITALGLLLAACQADPATSQSQETPSDSPGEPSPPAQPDPRDKIIALLEAYYEALEREVVDVDAFFAPTVDRFINSNGLSREQIAKSLQNGFQAVENRQIRFDAAGLSVQETADGYVAQFMGEAEFVRSASGESAQIGFRNRIAFNRDFQITAYESEDASVPANTRTASQSPINSVKALAEAMLPEFQSGNFKLTPRYIHPEEGAYLIGHPGAYLVPYFLENFGDIFTHAPWLREGYEGIETQVRIESLPDFGCDEIEGFTKEGCFAQMIDGYDRLSTLMVSLNEAELGPYSDAAIRAVQKFERKVQAAVIETHSGIALYFGSWDGKWYLMVVDMGSFDCSA